MSLGVAPEERVAIASNTRVDWILADLGILCAGAATTTVYPSTNVEETAFILADSDSRVLIAEDAEQLAKVRERRAELPNLKHVVLIDADDARRGRPADDPEGWVLSLDRADQRGAEYLAKHPDAIKDAVGALAPTSSPRSSTPPAPPASPRACGCRTTAGPTWPRPSRSPAW